MMEQFKEVVIAVAIIFTFGILGAICGFFM